MNIVDIVDDEVFQCCTCKTINECKNFLSQGNFGIYHTNICRINAHFDEFLIYFNEIKGDIQVLIFTETWHCGIDITKYNIDGFSRYHSEHFINSSTGIVVFVKNDIDIICSEIILNTAISLLLTINIDNIKINILCLYRTPSFCAKVFITEFRNALNIHFSNNNIRDHNVVIGDININILPNSNETCYNDYLDLMTEFGFCSLINEITRETSTTESCIDHCFYNGPISLQSSNIYSCIFKNDITDHYSILLTFKIHHNQNNNKHEFKTINKLNVDQFVALISQEDWKIIYDENDIDKKAEILNRTIITHKTTATSIKKINSKNTPLKPWITPGILASINKRNELSVKVKKHKSNDRLKSYYKTFRNKLSLLLHKCKNDYYKNQISNTPSDQPRKLWQNIHEIIGTDKSKNPIKKILINNDIIHTNENAKQCANYFNDYFSKVGINIKNSINCDNRAHICNTQDVRMRDISMESFVPVNEIEILKYIKELRNNASPGLDTINTLNIKAIAQYIVQPLVHIINESFDKSIVPKVYKEAVITPIFKTGSKTDVTNYRPISVICNFAKILEKCIKHRLNLYLEDNNILNDKQYGFRNYVGTNDALLDYTSFIYNNLDSGKKVLTVFLDVKKAFDSVDHSNLLRELAYIGIQNKSLDWFKNYLDNRTQKVKINNILSISESIKCSVPQGTVLGPILFNVYMHRLFKNTVGEVMVYADDTALSYIGNNWDEVHDKATRDLESVYKWFSSMSMALNMTKTNYMTFSYNEVGQPMTSNILVHSCIRNSDIECNCQCIKQVTQTKYLGVIIDNKMQWHHHVDKINKKMRYLNLTFYKLRYILKRQLLKTVYFALAQSVIQYAIIVWGGIFKTTISPLMRSQNILLRIIMNKDSRYSTSMLYQEFEVMTLRQIYMYNISLFAIKNGHLWERVPETHNLRNQPKVKELKTSKTSTQRHFIYLGPKIFNMLPNQVQEQRMSPFTLKNIIKKLIFENHFSSFEKFIE